MLNDGIFDLEETKPHLGRRKFVKTLAILAGMTLTAEALAACGDATNTPAATAANATTSAAAATTAPATTTTVAATTAPATTTTVAATTASVAATTTTASSAATTVAAANSGAAPQGYTMIGTVATYKASTDPVAFTAASKNGFIYNQNGTLLAFSNVCTHRGCSVPYVAADGKFECPCHGSQYDKTGQVIKGPAPKRLPLFDTQTVGDILYAKLG